MMKHAKSFLIEIIWLFLGIATLGIAAYDWIQRGLGKDTYSFFGLSVLAIAMFAYRRTLRLKATKDSKI